MVERKSDIEKSEELQKRIEQLKAQKKVLEARTKRKERAERTHRLIQIGALSEKYLQCTNIEPDKYESILKNLLQIESVKRAIGQREPE